MRVIQCEQGSQEWIEWLKSVLDYNPETGIFTWKDGRFAGQQAGTNERRGKRIYRRICLKQKRYYAHRLAWLYMTGENPETDIDHKDQDGLNNRFSNLRLATRSQNNINSRLNKLNSTGVKGVRKQGNSYIAQMQQNRKTRYLGSFKTLGEAQTAREAAEKEAFGEFACAS